MKIAISTESTNDLTKELLVKYDVKTIAFQITLGDLAFKDGDYTNEQMFDLVIKNNQLPKTTALNEFEYTEYFESLKKDYDAVVHLCMSSGISSSCGNALRAAQNMENVYAVDTESLTSGIGMLAIYARELANGGLSAKEIAEKIESRKSSVQVSFVVEKLDFLRKGGRCSTLQMLGANLLNIRPSIVLKGGKLVSDKKYRGSRMARVVSNYAEEILSEYNTPDLKRVFITYSSATPEMIEAAETVCKNAGFEEILYTTASGTVASHCGPNTIGILYFNDGDKTL